MGVYTNGNIGSIFVGNNQISKICMLISGVWTTVFQKIKELKKVSNPTALSVGRTQLSATTTDNYALFGGGYDKNNASGLATVDAYNQSLTRSIPTALSKARIRIMATAINNYALFAGGGFVTTVDAYNQSLTRSMPTALSTGRDSGGATAINNYALFAGGYSMDTSYNTIYLATVDAYNQSLTRSIPTALSVARAQLGATTIGNYALFGGGYTGNSRSAVVEAYNQSLTRSIVTNLSSPRSSILATMVGNYALFGGGYDGSDCTTVETYNQSLTKSTASSLSSSHASGTATTLKYYALFNGGMKLDFANGTTNYFTTMDTYNASLTKDTSFTSSIGRSYLIATSVNNYALFGGGLDSNNQYTSLVEAYICE